MGRQANRKKKRQQAGRRKSLAAARPSPARAGGSAADRAAGVAGTALLVLATAATAALSARHLADWSPPGCGPGSGCDRAAASAWGTVPGLRWPTAYVGLAYFAGLLAARVVLRGRPRAWLRWLVRGGGAGSLLLTGVMIVEGYLCRYCLITHAANLLFLVLLEVRGIAPDRGAAPARPVLWFAGVFALATAVIAPLHLRHVAAAEQREEAALTRSLERLVEPPPAPPVAAPPPAPGGERDRPFSGRYRIGPERAPVRIVVISDYQCPDCRELEGQLRQVLASREDVSFSAKHFPFCADCNRIAREKNYSPHPNACWAARAAEAAGILDGAEGFWRMHQWLFQRHGSFTDAELKAALPGLGFDPAGFISTMQDPETLRRVLEDVEEAADLGLRRTPMVFINGVELRGWRAPEALRRAVERVAATHPPAGTGALDHPPGALEKHLRGWRVQPVRALPPDDSAWWSGPADAGAEIVVWGDYQEPYTAALDARIRAKLTSSPCARYDFRHYPIDQSCNPDASRTLHEMACRGAEAAEAAGRLGGVEAYWRMHAWLMSHQDRFDDAGLTAAAAAVGLDSAALLATMESPDVARAIRQDAAAARQMGLRAVPFFFVNGKRVPFWDLEGKPLVERIIDEACAAASP